MTVTVQPIDRARVGRIVLACLDQDSEKAAATVAEAISDDRVLELLDATLGALVGFLLLTIGDDNARQWASDWVLHARMETEAAQPNSSTEGNEIA